MMTLILNSYLDIYDDYKIIDAQRYYRNDKLHRDSKIGPAVIYPSGIRCWYRDGLRHRDSVVGDNGELIELPAIICDVNRQEYYKDGRFNRLSGPAFIMKGRSRHLRKSWHINGKEYPKFKSDQILLLQRIIRQLYFLKRPIIYAPNNLGGIYVKSQLLALIS